MMEKAVAPIEEAVARALKQIPLCSINATLTDESALDAARAAIALMPNATRVEELEGVIYRNCDPFNASEADKKIIEGIAQGEFDRLTDAALGDIS